MSSKTKLFAILLILVICTAVGLKLFYFSQKTNPATPPMPEKTEIEIFDQKLKKDITLMPIDEKIGQLMIIGLEHTYRDEHIKEMITKYHIGGINLLGRNIVDQNQVTKLIASLQASSTIPLFIGVDQEGGPVVRFKFLSELTPQSKIVTTEQAFKIGLDRGVELRNLGVNINFSPVLDYVSDTQTYLYTRTFETTPENTAALGEALIMGYRQSGIVPVAKHFPGYGNITSDPHKTSAAIDVTEGELNRMLIPFKKIATGGSVHAIMTAHTVIPIVDSKPATLSKKFLTELLRKNFKFDGVIMTDDLEMVSAGRATESIAVDAIAAGADMLISTYTPSKHIKIFEALKEAVLAGTIPEDQLNASVFRILKLKAGLGK